VSVLQRDPAATAATLARWLGDVAGAPDPVVTDVTIPGATGWSNETVLFDATWGTGDDRARRALVARIAPSGHQVFPDDTFDRQHAVMRALAERSTVPVPRIHWFDDDPSWFGRPFWVMDRVDGDVATDTPPYAASGWLHAADPDRQRRAWDAGVDAMAGVHAVDLGALGLPPGTYDADTDPLGAHLDHTARFLAWAEGGTPHALARRALHQLRRSRPEPSGPPCLVWGDARLSNLIYRDAEVVAVLDWEMSCVGDPLLDLGWWVFADRALTEGSGRTRLPGFPTTAETIARWSAATGRSADAFDWFELDAGLRFTVVMLRMGTLLADMGLVPPGFAEDNLISQALGRLLDR